MPVDTLHLIWSSNGHVEAVKLLLEKGADVTVTDNCRNTSLNHASSNGHVEIVKLLLKKGADVAAANECEYALLQSASFEGRIEVIRFLLEEEKNVMIADEPQYSLSLMAGRNEQVFKVDCTKLDVCGRNALHSAARGGHVDVLEYLLTTPTLSTSKVKVFYIMRRPVPP